MEGQSFNVFSIIMTKKDFKGGVPRCKQKKKEMRILEDLFSDFIFFLREKKTLKKSISKSPTLS